MTGPNTTMIGMQGMNAMNAMNAHTHTAHNLHPHPSIHDVIINTRTNSTNHNNSMRTGAPVPFNPDEILLDDEDDNNVHVQSDINTNPDEISLDDL